MDSSNIYLRQFAQIYHKAEYFVSSYHKEAYYLCAFLTKPIFICTFLTKPLRSLWDLGIVTADLILTQRIYNYITVRKQMKLDRRRACTCGIVVVIPGLDSAVRIRRIGSDILYVILIDWKLSSLEFCSRLSIHLIVTNALKIKERSRFPSHLFSMHHVMH